MQEINIKEIIKTGLILFAVTALAALFLACANKVTSPIISENQTKKTYEAMGVVMPEATEFESVDFDTDKNTAIAEAYEAKNGSGEKIGSCVVAKSNGYGGEIKVLVGIDIDGVVTGINIMSHSETPGLGANATKPSFYEQFVGKTLGITAVKNSAAENEINAMSGATVTSRAVTSAVNAALDFAETN